MIDFFLCFGTCQVFYVWRPSTVFLLLVYALGMAMMVMQIFCNPLYLAVTIEVQARNDVFILHLLDA